MVAAKPHTLIRHLTIEELLDAMFSLGSVPKTAIEVFSLWSDPRLHKRRELKDRLVVGHNVTLTLTHRDNFSSGLLVEFIIE
jgi:hypothetical protein